MAFPTAVNDQITDFVTQANTKVLGDAPAIAMGNLYQATAQALANAAHNATNAQQQKLRHGAGRDHHGHRHPVLARHGVHRGGDQRHPRPVTQRIMRELRSAASQAERPDD